MINKSMLISGLFLGAILAMPTMGLSANNEPNAIQKTGQYIDDAAITAKVKAELVKDSHLHASDISVTTEQGVVHLSGKVNSRKSAERAVAKAESIEGVQSVVDELIVK